MTDVDINRPGDDHFVVAPEMVENLAAVKTRPGFFPFPAPVRFQSMFSLEYTNLK
jgi:hypothetical protein